MCNYTLSTSSVATLHNLPHRGYGSQSDFQAIYDNCSYHSRRMMYLSRFDMIGLTVCQAWCISSEHAVYRP